MTVMWLLSGRWVSSRTTRSEDHPLESWRGPEAPHRPDSQCRYERGGDTALWEQLQPATVHHHRVELPMLHVERSGRGRVWSHWRSSRRAVDVWLLGTFPIGRGAGLQLVAHLVGAGRAGGDKLCHALGGTGCPRAAREVARAAWHVEGSAGYVHCEGRKGRPRPACRLHAAGRGNGVALWDRNASDAGNVALSSP